DDAVVARARNQIQRPRQLVFRRAVVHIEKERDQESVARGHGVEGRLKAELAVGVSGEGAAQPEVTEERPEPRGKCDTEFLSEFFGPLDLFNLLSLVSVDVR